MRIGIFGTFDVENYGDLLFPMIAERELNERLEDFELVRYSYHEKRSPSWCYDVKSLTSLNTEPPGQQRLDCILIGGGHLIRFDKAVAPGYAPPIPEIPHPTGYWLAPALAGIGSGLPVIWNAPSASDAFPEWSEKLLPLVLENSDYVALRDRSSVDALRRAGFDGTCSVVPDTVFAISRYFPRKDLRSRVKNLLSRLKLRDRYIVVQAYPSMVAIIEALLYHPDVPSDLDVLVLPIGPALGDDVSPFLKVLPKAKHLPEWPSPIEIAGLVAHSAGVIAQSLHLSISALAYGLPVLRPAEAKGGKYTLLQASDNVYYASPQDSGAIAKFARAVQSGTPRICSFTKAAQGKLEKHWDYIADICRQHRPSCSSSTSNPFAKTNLLLKRLEELSGEQEVLLSSDERFKILQQEKEIYKSKIYSLKSKLSESDRKNLELSKQVREQQETIANILVTWSWRITHPLRGIADLFVLLKNKVAFLYEDAGLGIELLKNEGIETFSGRLYWYLRGKRLPHEIPRTSRYFNKKNASNNIDYYKWIQGNDTLSDKDRSLIRNHIKSFDSNPKFSVLMPVYNTKGEYLRQAIDSVLGQLYENWELCIVDDSSTSTEVHNILREYEEKDSRIRPSFRQENGGISACTNTALEMASGDWIVLLDHDDLLSEHALYLVTDVINENPNAAIIYSDEDRIDSEGRRSAPYFKPDWDYDLFLGQNLISHLGAYRTDLAQKVRGFREGFEGSQDWDFALRVVEIIRESEIYHIPFILYHWREIDASFSNSSSELARDAAQRLVNEHFERTNQSARANSEGHSSFQSIKRELPLKCPHVSVIIPTKDQSGLLMTCIDGLFNRTDYEPIEIIIVDNGSSEQDALEFLENVQSNNNVRVVKDPGPFNFSRLVNNGIAGSSGEVCVLLNNDTKIINSGWLDEMVSHAIRPEVGAVGAKLYYSDNTIQHGGVILGIGGVADHAYRDEKREYPGYGHRLLLTQSLSCVTAACMAVKRDVFNEIGGLNEKDLTVAYNDVDLCIRIRQAGYKIIWTPQAELYHLESWSRGYDTDPERMSRLHDEAVYMKNRWGHILDNDPSYNPNLSLDSGSFDLALNTRVNKPWLGGPSNTHSIANQQSKTILKPIVFVHIPKTAGTTINLILKESCGYGIDHLEGVFNSSEFEKWISQLRWISGHISRQKFVDFIAKYYHRDNVYFFSCVRHPLNQVMSHLNWFIEIQKRGKEFFHSHPSEIQLISYEASNANFHEKKNLMDFLSKHEHFFFNRQSRYILDNQLLDTSSEAISSCIEQFDFIGLTEDLNPLIQAMGIKCYSIPEENVSKYHFNKEIFLDEDVIQFLENHNHVDYRLYEKVKEHFYMGV